MKKIKPDDFIVCLLCFLEIISDYPEILSEDRLPLWFSCIGKPSKYCYQVFIFGDTPIND